MRRAVLLSFLLVLVVCAKPSVAQSDATRTIRAKHAVYFELLGTGVVYSMNVERVFENRMTIRGGVSALYWGGSSNSMNYMAFPVSTSYLHTVNPDIPDFHLEFGISGLFITTEQAEGPTVGGIVGFRKQNFMQSGHLVRFSLTPLYVTGKDKGFRLWYGISFGRGF